MSVDVIALWEAERLPAAQAEVKELAAEVERATAAWDAAYWGSFDEAQHQIITAARPGIFSCFNQADVLISDVSSVVSDWLASEKPYAVANTSGMTEDEFRAAFTTVRAATILAPAGDGVPALLAALHARGVRSVLLEGGPVLAGSFVAAGTVDTVVGYLAPVLLGAGPAALADAGITTLSQALRLAVTETVRIGPDLRVTAVPVPARKGN